jgi:hypothetical protein
VWVAQGKAGSSIKNRMEDTPAVASPAEAVAHFVQLLADASVRPTDRWRDVYTELATDGRYKLLKTGERKKVRCPLHGHRVPARTSECVCMCVGACTCVCLCVYV